ncbi:MAG: hypothetical protein ABEI77_05295 [Halorientalis sp.]
MSNVILHSGLPPEEGADRLLSGSYRELLLTVKEKKEQGDEDAALYALVVADEIGRHIASLEVAGDPQYEGKANKNPREEARTFIRKLRKKCRERSNEAGDSDTAELWQEIGEEIDARLKESGSE